MSLWPWSTAFCLLANLRIFSLRITSTCSPGAMRIWDGWTAKRSAAPGLMVTSRGDEKELVSRTVSVYTCGGVCTSKNILCRLRPVYGTFSGCVASGGGRAKRRRGALCGGWKAAIAVHTDV